MKHDWKKWLSLGLCAGLCTGIFAGTEAINAKADDLTTVNLVIPGCRKWKLSKAGGGGCDREKIASMGCPAYENQGADSWK